MFALLRSDAVNLPLFLHVLGALLLSGSLFTVALTSLLGWRGSETAAGLNRLSLRTVLLGVFPSYLLMRAGAQWTENEEGLNNLPEDPAWLTVGYITADLGMLITLISTVLAAVGLRRLRNGNGLTFARITGVLSTAMFVAYLVALWAMSTKPV